MALKARTTAETTVQALATQGLHVIATVRESPSVTDLAVERAQSRIVVRCVERATQGDERALATMLTEGDFDRAFLVHTGDETDFTGEIQTWPLSRIDELAALLAKESAP